MTISYLIFLSKVPYPETISVSLNDQIRRLLYIHIQLWEMAVVFNFVLMIILALKI